MDNELQRTEVLKQQLEKLVRHLESLNFAAYMELLERPAKLLFINFIAGLSRGLGIAIGATFVFAMMLEFFRRLILLNIPGIGGVIAEIVHIVEMKNGKF